MSHVIAIIDQDTYRVYPDKGSVPQGAVVFSSPEELAAALPIGTLDKIRGKLLGEYVEPSPTREIAALRLWYVFGLGAEFAKIDWSSRGYNRKKDNFGNNKIADASPIELIQLLFTPGRDHMADFFYKKLPKQAKKIVDILREDGKGIWTNEQANAVIASRESEIETAQGAMKVFNYYKSQLFREKMLRRISFADFVGKPEFSGISLDHDKEGLENP